MSRIPLARIEQQSEPIREFIARRGNLNAFRLLANAPNVFVGWTRMVDELLMVINRYSGLALMLNALDVDLDETARLPIPPRHDGLTS